MLQVACMVCTRFFNSAPCNLVCSQATAKRSWKMLPSSLPHKQRSRSKMPKLGHGFAPVLHMSTPVWCSLWIGKNCHGTFQDVWFAESCRLPPSCSAQSLSETLASPRAANVDWTSWLPSWLPRWIACWSRKSSGDKSLWPQPVHLTSCNSLWPQKTFESDPGTFFFNSLQAFRANQKNIL